MRNINPLNEHLHTSYDDFELQLNALEGEPPTSPYPKESLDLKEMGLVDDPSSIEYNTDSHTKPETETYQLRYGTHYSIQTQLGTNIPLTKIVDP